MKALVPYAAGGTFPARLLHGETEEKFGYRDHTIILIQHDHPARAHHGAGSGKAFVVDRSVEVLFRQAATRRPPGLYRLELLPVLDASTNLVDDLTKSDTHRHLYQPHIIDLPCKGKHFCPFRFFGADSREPVGPLQDDHRHVGQCLHVIYIGRFTKITALCGERRFIGGFPPFSFHRVDKGRLLTADKSTGAILHADIKAEAGAENIFPQQPIITCLGDGCFQSFDRKRVLRTDIDQPFRGTNTVAADSHRLQHRMRVSL